MWEAIKWYCENGYESFCFGRTKPENKGLMQFKSGWGAEQNILPYYKYDLRREAFVEDNPKLTGIHNKIFGKMPIPLLRLAGQLLYPHMAWLHYALETTSSGSDLRQSALPEGIDEEKSPLKWAVPLSRTGRRQ